MVQFSVTTKTISLSLSLSLSLSQFDADGNGHITAAEIGNVMKALGESVPGYKIRDMIKEVDIDENGTVEFDEFLAVSGLEELHMM